MFGKKLSREKFLVFLSEAPPCLVVMEACGGAHYWGRQIIALGHRCMLIPPIYVKPFLKRQKNDSNDAAAIVEAAQRPTMRFVAVKSEEAQADAMLFRTRALLVRQRTQTINSLRSQLAEFGVIAAQGMAGVAVMRLELAEVEGSLPEQVVSMAKLLFEQVAALGEQIADLEKEIRSRTRARGDEAADDDPRHRPDLCDGAACLCAADGELRLRARLRGLDRADTAAALDGRQAAVRPDHQDGPARSPPVARPGSNVGAPAYAQARGAG